MINLRASWINGGLSSYNIAPHLRFEVCVDLSIKPQPLWSIIEQKMCLIPFLEQISDTNCFEPECWSFLLVFDYDIDIGRKKFDDFLCACGTGQHDRRMFWKAVDCDQNVHQVSFSVR